MAQQFKTRIPESKYYEDAEEALSSRDQDALSEHEFGLTDFLEEKGAVKSTFEIPEDLLPRDGAFHYSFETWNYKKKTFFLRSGEAYTDEVYAARGTYTPQDIAFEYFLECLENEEDEDSQPLIKVLEFLSK